jgi:hypothetical protein
VLVFERGKLRPVAVPWYQRLRIAKSAPRPHGYLIPPGWPAIERRLFEHGLKVERLAAPLEIEVETMRVEKPKFSGRSYQGLTEVSGEIVRAIERRKIPAGALHVPAAQPEFAVAAQLLEPEAPDSLFSWGLISGFLEGKEYIDTAKLDGLVEKMLADPAVRSEWEKALADPAFAADKRARYTWWYRRTAYWDEQQGLVPAFRLLAPLPR